MYLLYMVIDINQSNVNVVGQLRGILATIILVAGIVCCSLVFREKRLLIIILQVFVWCGQFGHFMLQKEFGMNHKKGLFRGCGGF